MLSFNTTGIPCSAPAGSSRSSCSARASACSLLTTTAFSAGPVAVVGLDPPEIRADKLHDGKLPRPIRRLNRRDRGLRYSEFATHALDPTPRRDSGAAARPPPQRSCAFTSLSEDREHGCAAAALSQCASCDRPASTPH